MSRRSKVAAPRIGAGLLFVAASSLAPAAHAETFSTCTGFVSSLPATISSAGTWCLATDLSTAITSGAAITIASNNVTLDCNGHRIGGLSGGPATNARGVQALSRQNVAIRNCAVRGFRVGIDLTVGRYLVEDNVLDKNTNVGIYLFAGDGVVPEAAEGAVIRRNLVLDTGGTDGAAGIITFDQVHIVDNVVSKVLGGASDISGIRTSRETGSISGNRVSGLVTTGGAVGIRNLLPGRIVVSGNHLFGPGSGVGISCQGPATTIVRARDNSILAFPTGLGTCGDAGGNDIAP
jgi:hypothetical protein